MDNWKPKVGEYAVRFNKHLIKVHMFKDFCSGSYGRGAEICYLKDCEYLWDEYEHFRPAVLDDFAVEIPDYGKVWFVNIGDRVVVREVQPLYDHLVLFTRHFDQWVLNALIAHYRITVMPVELWEKLRK